MLYPKSKEKFSIELFKNPTAEYRGKPFWAWNCKLEKEELLRQIDVLTEMGFGGFIMHSRSGMETKYLSKEFFDLIKLCTEKAESKNINAWLYDEDRWPSGSAGGMVTSNPKYRQKMLLFTTKEVKDGVKIASFDISLNEIGEIVSYQPGSKWNAYIITAKNSGWFNGNCYVDTLNSEAIDCFVKTTHEKYKDAAGEFFGKTIPAIFTDEPQFALKQTLPFANSTDDVTLPWTNDFEETFEKAYGFSITEKLPELSWELPEGKASRARYCYHDHVCARFKEAFLDTCQKWCKENNIYLTGHVLGEHTLITQTEGVGEVMRCYGSFDLPGIDVLCDDLQLLTAKQVQSSARQQGKEGVMSELYGVTSWDFDFKGHLAQGNWQAALGVTARVPHLSWVSMKGAAKRDFPASINYQSPWYKEYSYIENHFARLNTVLTRGKPMVNVGVIHPIESYWLHFGPNDVTSGTRNQLEKNCQKLIEYLLFNTIDFDFICEADLPQSCIVTDKFSVGQMDYTAILVPACETLRSTTVKLLNDFIQNGGTVIFAGECPKYIDGKENAEIKKLYNRSITVPFEEKAITDALKAYKNIEIRNEKGEISQYFLYQLRQDGNDRWLYIANTKSYYPDLHSEQNGDIIATDAVIKITGEFTPVIYDTFSGEVVKINYEVKNGCTILHRKFHDTDSLLLRLTPFVKCEKIIESNDVIADTLDFKERVEFICEEDNVCLLDMAQYSLDGDEFKPLEEVLRIDKALRKSLNWSEATGGDIQPWAIAPEQTTHYVDLMFTFHCEFAVKNTFLCAEESVKLTLNGKNVKLKETGYYVDKAIKKYPLPALKKGTNTIIARVPFGKRLSLEPMYLTGNFDVGLDGINITIKKRRSKIAFGDITNQGMPFYSGNITYKTTVNFKTDCDILINASLFKGSLVKVYVDGEDKGIICTPPYNLKVKNLKKGTHKIDFKLFGNRYNTFGALHNCGPSFWHGIEYWYSEGDSWCYQYNLKKAGIIKSPVIKVLD